MIKFVAAVALPCVLAAGEPVHMAYQFGLDEPVHYQMIQEVNQTQSVGGQSSESNSTIKQRSKTELLELRDDGSLIIANTQESIAVSIDGGGITINYNSENPDDQAQLSNPMVASFAAMKGMQVQIQLAPDGTVLDIPNIDELNKLVDAMTDPNIQAGVRPMMQRDTLVALNEANYKLLPQQDVEVGDQWQRSYDIPFAFGKMTMTFDLTLDKVTKVDDERMAQVSLVGQIEIPDMNDENEPQISTKITTSSIIGSFTFDLDDGEMDSMNTTMSMAIVSTMAGVPEPFTITTEQKVRLNRLDD